MEVVYKNCISMLNRRNYEFIEKDDDNNTFLFEKDKGGEEDEVFSLSNIDSSSSSIGLSIPSLFI